MILDEIKYCSKYNKLHPNFKLAFDFITNNNLAELEDGKVEILNDAVFAIISTIEKNGEPSKFEVHDAYIDIQYVIEGLDRIGYKTRKDCKQSCGDFDVDNDYLLFDDEVNNVFDLPKQSFAILYPNDAHAPLYKVNSLKKVVIKVRL